MVIYGVFVCLFVSTIIENSYLEELIYFPTLVNKFAFFMANENHACVAM